jgi:dTDP-4-amino-4,6-dideoxygalactose transaminase
MTGEPSRLTQASQTWRIPQADPRATYRERAGEIDRAVLDALGSGRYILGSNVATFEAEFAEYIGVGFAVGVANGTDALELALRAVGAGPGSAVFTAANTASATVAAIQRAGARAVLVDVLPETLNIDPAGLAEAAAACRTDPGRFGTPVAIVPVHLYGAPADMPAVAAVARAQGLRVVEDCAQAHGASIGGRRVGGWGDAGCFSFYPTKNLAAFGDGGAVVTRDPDIAERVSMLRQYGWRERYVSSETGFNSRLDELQAAILRVQLPSLDADNARRQRLADFYDTALGSTDITLPSRVPGAAHVFHQYVIRTRQRDCLARYLAGHGVQTAVHYPVPIHLQPGFAGVAGSVEPLDQAERAAGEILSLPMHPALTERDAREVADHVGNWAGAAG